MLLRMAAAGGPIALVENGDLIALDVEKKYLAIIGTEGVERAPEEMEEILKLRAGAWKAPEKKYKRGLLKRYTEHAVSPMEGRIWINIWTSNSREKRTVSCKLFSKRIY